MGATHIRLPRNFVLEERLERFGAAIERCPERLRGRWASACWPLGGPEPGPGRFREVRLDQGCGKGAWLISRARRCPRTLFVGMDAEHVCIAYAAQHVVDSGLRNIVIVPRSARSTDAIFAPGELAAIALNFPTPHPKSRHARLRLTDAELLLAYRRALAPGGTVSLRTDSQPLRDYSLTQFLAAGYRLIWTSDDARRDHPGEAESEYERRLVARGATVFGVCAAPGAEPSAAQLEAGRSQERGLVAYLPSDPRSLPYIPLGMEAAVANLANRRLKERRGGKACR